MIALSVPLPPTSNHRLIPVGGRQVKSPEYRQWMDAAAWQMRSQLTAQNQFEALASDVFVSVAVTFPDRRKRDLDNVLKPVNDALVKGKVIEDDSLISCQVVYRQGIVKDDAKVEIFIYTSTDAAADKFGQVMKLSQGGAAQWHQA